MKLSASLVLAAGVAIFAGVPLASAEDASASAPTPAPAPASASEAATSTAPLDLDRAIALALEHNYTIRQARARYAESTGAVTEATAAALPRVTADANYTRIDPNLITSINGVRFSSPTSWNAGVTARQTVYNAAVSAGVRASVAARAAAVADFEASVQQALLNVREAYFAVLLARAQVGVQEQSVKLLEEELTTAKSRVQAGSGSPFEQLRAEVALANGQPALIRARNTYRQSAVELLRAIGLPSTEGAEDSVVGELTFSPREYSLETVLGSAHANRAELRQLEKIVSLRESAVDAARAGSKPTVDAFAGYGIQKKTNSDNLDDTVDGWNIGVSGSWAIFDGRATKGRVEQARAQLEQAKLSLDETTLAIDAEVRQDFSSFREAKELVDASKLVVQQAEESLRLARSRFTVGAATQLDVLTAQVDLTTARSNASLALHDANVAWARLERAAALTPMPTEAKLPQS